MILAAVIQGITALVATNIDDILVLMMFFGQRESGFQPRHIVIGQYLGFGALVALSVLGFLGTLVIPQEWVGVLGFLPIALGLRKLWQLKKITPSPPPAAEPLSVKERRHKVGAPSRFLNPQILGVAAVTFANGGDNIAIYVPLFAGAGLYQTAVIITVLE